MIDGDPDHPIVERPFEYRVIGFCFQRTLDDSEESYIDLTLQREQVVRRLRFFSPRSVSIEEGFPEGCGMYIADVQQRGLDGLGVRVGDFEASPGAIQFWARTVVDLDTPPPAAPNTTLQPTAGASGVHDEIQIDLRPGGG